MKTKHLFGRKMNYGFWDLSAAEGEKAIWFDYQECRFVEDTDNSCSDSLLMKCKRLRRRQYLRKRDVFEQVPMTKRAFYRMLRKLHLRNLHRGMRFQLSGYYGTYIEGKVKK